VVSGFSTEEQFAMGVETAALSEAERGEDCRKRGMYPERRQAWRRACEQANAGQAAPRPKHATQAADQRRIQELERALQRKERALAETAALLGLRKKAEAIGGKDADL
jgi:hypothetical protein